MRPNRFDQIPCPIGRATDLLGDPWIPMILRECTYGVARFEDFRERLGIGRNVLATRLERMIESGLLEKWRYQESPPRDGYRLTLKGRGATTILAAMIRFANDWVFGEEQAPVLLCDAETGRALRPVVVDETTGQPIATFRTKLAAGPGFPGDDAFKQQWFNPETPTRRAAASPPPEEPPQGAAG